MSGKTLPETPAAMAEGLNIQQILKMIPHRYPFLLVDRATEVVPGKYIKAYKNITFNEPFFTGHFPERPVMPGVLILEGMVQAAGLLIVKTENLIVEENQFFFASMENIRFRRPVVPGDRLDMHCEVLRYRRNLWKTECKAFVDGALVTEGILTFAVIPIEENV